LLYVEDEATIRDIVCTFVRKTFPDIQLYTVENGNEGLERFKELRPDIGEWNKTGAGTINILFESQR